MNAIIQKCDEVTCKLANLGYSNIPFSITMAEFSARVAGKICITNISPTKVVGEITINSLFYKEFPKEILSETVPHEICHLYVSNYFPRAKQAHGPEFKLLMRAIGCAGDTYHNMYLKNVPTAKKRLRYVYEDSSTYEKHYLTSYHHKKAQEGIPYISKNTGNTIRFTDSTAYI